jgi:hypothetical protein
MQERYLGRIQPGMDVCDAQGGKVGSVARVHRYDVAEIGITTTVATRPRVPDLDEILEVKTGPLGLGGHLYVPLRMIEEVASDCITLSVSKRDDEVKRWKARPNYLAQLY